MSQLRTRKQGIGPQVLGIPLQTQSFVAIYRRPELQFFPQTSNTYLSRTKELARNLCDELRPHMKSPKRSTDLSVETKVLIALSFYATGSYQRPTGNNESHFVAQQTVSSAISQVTKCLNSLQMRQKHIRFPVSNQERNTIKSKFYNKFGIPGVLGCIDCSQVAIIRPVVHEERYFC